MPQGSNCAQPGSTLDVRVLSGGVLLKQKIISLVRPAGLQLSHSTPSVLVRLVLEACPEAARNNLLLGNHLGFFVCFGFCSTGDQSQGLKHGCTSELQPQAPSVLLKEKTNHCIHFKKDGRMYKM